MAELDWRIEAAASQLAKAFASAREGDLFFAGTWLGRAETNAAEIRDREARGRAYALCSAVAHVLYGLDYKRQKALAELAELKAKRPSARGRGGRRG